MKKLTNTDIAESIEETGKRYEMLGVPYKPRAYQRAAMGVSDFGGSVADLFKKRGVKGLEDINGVGPGIASHIAQLLTTGTFKEYETLKKKAPMDVQGLTALESVGPKRAMILWKELGVKNVKQLEQAAKKGELRDVAGLGEKFEEHVLRGLETRKTKGERKLLGFILPFAERVVAQIRAMPGVKHAEVAGSVRRRQETIGDLDFIVTAENPSAVMKAFMAMPQVSEVLEKGSLKAMVRLDNGMHADLLAVKDASYGGALHHFTGSRDHNIELRKIAIKKGFKMNEFGLWKGKKLVASHTEEDLYRALGLPWIPPEIRTNEGEIEAARNGELPDLIPYGSLLGDMQVQTDWTDGAASIETMAKEAKKRGLAYMTVTDHTKALAFIHGLDEKRVAAQGRAIDAVNKKLKGFTILKGSECDILKDGSMDLADKTLEKLDFVGASVHSHFRLSRSEQTRRVIRAMENPHVDAIFHPTGRKVLSREPIDLDMDAIVKAAKATGTALEIDGDPSRMDLRDEHVRLAVKAGVKFVIDSDAHHPREFDWLEFGVATARRGWATKDMVINTRPLADVREWLKMDKKKRK